MQTQPEINWWLEIAKIGVPVATTILVGWLISHRNEKFKNELAQDLHRFQTRDSLLHQKQAEAIQEIYGLISEITFTAGGIQNSYLKGNLAHFKGQQETIERIFKRHYSDLLAAQDKLVSRSRAAAVFLDDDVNSAIEEIQDNLISACADIGVIFAAPEIDLTIQEPQRKQIISGIDTLLANALALMPRLRTIFREMLSPNSLNLKSIKR
jgi:hypothetical protein